MKTADINTTSATAIGSGSVLPNIDIRFSPIYAWLGIIFGAVFFILGVIFAVEHHHRHVGLGLFIALLSVATIVGCNYWRRHLHIVAQITAQQLILRREGALEWSEIMSIDNKTIHSRYHGVGHASDFICIKLKNRPPSKNGLEAFFHKAKHAVTGYDIIVGESELACTAGWFVAECRKRMAAFHNASMV